MNTLWLERFLHRFCSLEMRQFILQSLPGSCFHCRGDSTLHADTTWTSPIISEHKAQLHNWYNCSLLTYIIIHRYSPLHCSTTAQHGALCDLDSGVRHQNNKAKQKAIKANSSRSQKCRSVPVMQATRLYRLYNPTRGEFKPPYWLVSISVFTKRNCHEIAIFYASNCFVII